MDSINPAEIAYIPTTGVRHMHEAPLVLATEESLEGYRHIVHDPKSFPIEITRWPAQGWRPIDKNSGDQGGVTEGIFESWWSGETLYARNGAVGDSYLFGWSNWPVEAATQGPTTRRERALIWRANDHPDGGQLFYPTNGQRRVAFLPGVAMTLKSLRKKDFSDPPEILSDHLRKRRSDLGLSQRETAARMRVVYWTYLNWEQAQTRPGTAQFRPVVEFLGYDPSPPSTTLREHLEAQRRTLGVTLEQVAKYLNWDPGSLTCYLDGRWPLSDDRAAALEAFLDLDTSAAASVRAMPRRYRPIARLQGTGLRRRSRLLADGEFRAGKGFFAGTTKGQCLSRTSWA